MYGAILGDVLGSIEEQVPHLPKRTRHEPTDDSLLSCAAYEWCELISHDELQYLHEKSTRIALYRRACAALAAWANAFPQPDAFSKGFVQWVQKVNAGCLEARPGNTNGCLMRSSAITEFCRKNGLSRWHRHALVSLFSRTSHNHLAALRATLAHSDVIDASFDVALGRITKSELLEDFSADVQGVAYWQAKADAVPSRFLWKATDSWHIALSGLALSNSFEELMSFFAAVGGDVDTYGAIAGPIAQNLFDTSREVAQVRSILARDDLAHFAQVHQLFEQMLALAIAPLTKAYP